MEITNKTIDFLGDSITEGAGASCPDNAFVSVFAKKYKPLEARNYGISGTRIARQYNPTVIAPRFDLDFNMRAEEMEQSDIVVVFGGTNDFGHGDAPFGSEEDKTSDTFCGAVNALIAKLKKYFPKTYIMFITPIHRTNEANPKGDSGKHDDCAFPLVDYVNVIRRACAREKIALLDLFADPDFALDGKLFGQIITADGLHPSDEGHALIADKIAEFIHKA